MVAKGDEEDAAYEKKFFPVFLKFPSLLVSPFSSSLAFSPRSLKENGTCLLSPVTISAVAHSTLHVTASFSTSLANTTLLTNWTLPRAASKDCAAKPKETKLKTFPRAKSAMPACHSLKERAGRGFDARCRRSLAARTAEGPFPPAPSEEGGGEGTVEEEGEAGALFLSNSSRARDLLWPSFIRFWRARGRARCSGFRSEGEREGNEEESGGGVSESRESDRRKRGGAFFPLSHEEKGETTNNQTNERTVPRLIRIEPSCDEIAE